LERLKSEKWGRAPRPIATAVPKIFTLDTRRQN
jgi:hypothetical protein